MRKNKRIRNETTKRKRLDLFFDLMKNNENKKGNEVNKEVNSSNDRLHDYGKKDFNVEAKYGRKKK